MKFLKLLDPWATQEGSSLTVGEQQQRCAELFPQLVERSNLHYWSPGDEVTTDGRRILIGLAASFDLKDLRLADIINDELNRNCSVRVDVFNVAKDCANAGDLAKYYPNHPESYFATPIVGFWQDGDFESMECGFEARRLILAVVNSSTSAEESVAGLTPPAPHLMED